MTKEQRLDDFCQQTGHELSPTTREMWLALPELAFAKKLAEWSDWSSLGGRLVFQQEENMAFDYDDWLATEPDYCVHEDAMDEDEVYDRWVEDTMAW